MKVGDLINVGDLVKCTMLADQNIGLVIRAGFHSAQVHFATPPDHGDDLAHWKLLSSKGVIELPTWHWELEVVNESR